MSIDEAITHCLEVADGQTAQGRCPECAEEHRQLAEWLTDYKRLKEREPNEGKAYAEANCGECHRRYYCEASPDSCIYSKIAQAEPEKVDDKIRVGGERMPCDEGITPESLATAFQFGMAFGFAKKYDEMDKVMEEVKKAVTPQAMPKMGHWITKDGQQHGFDIGGVKTWYIQIMCSECGFIKTAIEGHTGQYHYCPNCGAKMEEMGKNG